MSDRLAKYGQFVTTAGENIAYGSNDGKDIVLQLFIDDGVASRGHRTNIMKPEFKVIGSWSAGHQTYQHETVVNYAGGFTSNGQYAVIQKIDCTPASSSSSSTSGTTSSTNGTSSTDSSSNTTAPAAPTAEEIAYN